MDIIDEILVVLVYEDKDRLSNSLKYPAHVSSEITRSITSLREVTFVKEELEKEGFNVLVYELEDFCSEAILSFANTSSKQALVWSVTDGEHPFKGGSIPAVSRLFGLPYLGSSSFVRGICNAKHIWKNQISLSVPVPWHKVIYHHDELGQFIDGLTFPLFVKPARFGNSAGISLVNPVVKDNEQLNSIVDTFIEMHLHPVLIEPYLSGTEFAVAAIHTDKWYLRAFQKDFPDEYLLPEVKDGSRHHEFSITEIEGEQLKASALKAIDILDIKDYVRFDFRADESGDVYLIDINSGCFLLGSTMRDFIASFGQSFGDGFGQLIKASLARQLN